MYLKKSFRAIFVKMYVRAYVLYKKNAGRFISIWSAKCNVIATPWCAQSHTYVYLSEFIFLIPCHQKVFSADIGGTCKGKIAFYSYHCTTLKKHKYYSLSLTAEKCTNCKTPFLFLYPPTPAARNPLLSRLGGENRFLSRSIRFTKRERDSFPSAMLNVFLFFTLSP